MIDKIEIRLLFKPECMFIVGQSHDHQDEGYAPVLDLVRDDEDTEYYVDLYKYKHLGELKYTQAQIDVDDRGYIITGPLKCSYESLPSSHSGIAFKVWDIGKGEFKKPYVELKCSPAKIMQGHNVYGFDDFKLGFFEILATFASIYPNLYKDLEIETAELRCLDVTYFSRATSDSESEKIIQAIQKVSNRQTKASINNYDTTAYFNPGSQYCRKKVYLKRPEVKKHLDKLQKILDSKGFPNRPLAYQAEMNKNHDITLNAYSFTKGMVRFEASYYPMKLKDIGVPINCFLLIKFIENQRPTLMVDLWKEAFKDVFDALQGLTIDRYDDDSIINAIRLKHDKIKDNGRVCSRRSNAVIKFYVQVKTLGYYRMKKLGPEKTFYRNLNYLIESGLSKAFIQNIDPEFENVVPLIKEININFGEQTPVGYKKPLSAFELKLVK